MYHKGGMGHDREGKRGREEEQREGKRDRRGGRGREEGQILILQKLKLALSEENPEHV